MLAPLTAPRRTIFALCGLAGSIGISGASESLTLSRDGPASFRNCQYHTNVRNVALGPKEGSTIDGRRDKHNR